VAEPREMLFSLINLGMQVLNCTTYGFILPEISQNGLYLQWFTTTTTVAFK
jgi:hypothetical protein